ncbi:MAG: geranylgeranyl reductase family protein [Methanomassiliicoccales archaeon]|jgi:digeranylgeranylglycerophospholipid reductase|nr:geranylgeranyl reductase family protein [Methanomassiliicoccales archaeon]
MAERLSTDILVVGAGPAGSTAAEHAALHGADVLLIERKKEIGIPFACGEFLPSIDEVKRIFPGARDIDTLFDIPRELISLETHRLRIYSPELRVYEFDFDGFTTYRDRFDQYLASKALKAGAKVLTGCTFISIDGDRVVTNQCEVKAKLVIGADGPRSRVAKSLGLPKNRELCPAVTAQAVGNFEPVAEMYFGNIAPGGYAWILPKRGGANVGVGISPRFASKTVGEYFKEFIDWKQIDVGKPAGKYVPMGGPLHPNYNDKGLIVGDAAGHVMAVNGGGIPIALICGKIAGEVAAACVRSGESISRYGEECRRQVEKPLRIALRTKVLADLCWGSRRRLELAMRVLGKRRMANIIRCKRLFP